MLINMDISGVPVENGINQDKSGAEILPRKAVIKVFLS